MNYLKLIYIVVSCLLLVSCTVYTLKDSESLSKSIYHANDSFDKGRFDLTDSSLDEAIRIAKPPKKRIQVDEVVPSKTSNSTITPRLDVLASNSGKNKPVGGQRTIIIPERFKGMTVVVVNSDEYMELLKDKRIHLQLKVDHENLKKLKEEVDAELIEASENAQKLVDANNSMKTELEKKDHAILKRNIITVVLVLVIAGGIYLRIKGIL
jgi:hypothetical protein